jgi:hypothetical protein
MMLPIQSEPVRRLRGTLELLRYDLSEEGVRPLQAEGEEEEQEYGVEGQCCDEGV